MGKNTTITYNLSHKMIQSKIEIENFFSDPKISHF